MDSGHYQNKLLKYRQILGYTKYIIQNFGRFFSVEIVYFNFGWRERIFQTD